MEVSEVAEEDETKSQASYQMRKIGENRKKPKYVFVFRWSWVLYLPVYEDGMQRVQASSYVMGEYGYHKYFLNPAGENPFSCWYIVFHVRTGLPMEAFDDEKQAKIKVKRLVAGIDSNSGIDLTPRDPSNTDDDIPF